MNSTKGEMSSFFMTIHSYYNFSALVKDMV